MLNGVYLQRYMDALLTGDRRACREVIEDVLHNNNASIVGVYSEVIWPMMLEIDNLFRADKITSVQEHLATRINRTIIDQLQNKLPKQAKIEKKVVITSSTKEIGELGAQMIADMFESAGWNVRFIGGGLSNDDIMTYIHEFAPNVLVIYGTEPSDTPVVRNIIDRIRDVNAWPDMKIMLCGGVFGRADGLWEEIGADLYAATPNEAVETACQQNTSSEPVRTINKRKRKYQQLAKARKK
ncbi:MAG: B12 binding domain protein [Planctomycetes bacterium ADurb.Bin401]|nr:MAG: B12 binding domain protein [Planctomycetes bacterium ADurb.Bin401]